MQNLLQRTVSLFMILLLVIFAFTPVTVVQASAKVMT